MTNEEKAREIASTYSIFDGLAENKQYFIGALMEMAKWCNEQYSDEKKELLGLVKMLPVDEHNQTIIEDLVAMLNL